jgi:hypothetical protein
MTAEGNLDYALARVHARHGRLLDEAGWRRLEAGHDLDQYVDAARASTLAGWVASLDLTRDVHAIERALRNEWRQYVEAVATWHPHAWQPWLAWWAWLPVLSLLAQLSRSEPPPDWMLADPVCGPIAPGSPAERAAALRDTPLVPLESAILGHVSMGAAWHTHLQTLTPQSDAQTRQLLKLLLQAINTHYDRLINNTTSAMILRGELADRLERLFRADVGTVAATACHLALVALDFERLRGGLASRCVLSVRAAEAA